MLAHSHTAPAPVSRWEDLLLILRKELRVMRRQFQVRWRVAVEVALGLALMIHIVVLASAEEPATLNGVMYFDGLLGDLFALFNMENLVLVLCLGLVLPLLAGTLAREREQGTLDLLLLTPLRAREILLGKLCATLAPVMALMIAFTLVIAVMAAAFGLIEQDALPRLLPIGLLLLKVLCASAIAMWCSTRFDTLARALAAAVLMSLPLLLPVPANMQNTYEYWDIFFYFKSSPLFYPMFPLYVGALMLTSAYWGTWGIRQWVKRRTGCATSRPVSVIVFILLLLGLFPLYLLCLSQVPFDQNSYDLNLNQINLAFTRFLPWLNTLCLLAATATILQFASLRLESRRRV